MKKAGLLITPMAASDLALAVEVEQDTLSAWGSHDFTSELEQPGAVLFVAKNQQTGEFLGHICARTGVGEAEIMKLSVRESARRQGFCAGLLKHFLDFLRSREVALCYLELRASNQAGLALYKKNGFIETGFRKKYYSAPEEPAILMTNTLRDLYHNSHEVIL